MAYAEWFLKQRYQRMIDWIKGESPDGVRDRWTNADMFWAYKLGLKHAKKKPKELTDTSGKKTQ